MQMTERKARPILFSGEMVRPVLLGDKSQTRRVMKPQPVLVDNGQTWDWPKIIKRVGGHDISAASWAANLKDPHVKESCPYGKPGDHLWVREAFYVDLETDVFYHADYSTHDALAAFADAGAHWKPSIHMPRWASRITLEITDVRAERVQEISEEDAKAEGIEFRGSYWLGGKGTLQCWPTAQRAFRALWDSIYAIPKPRHVTINGKKVITHYESFPFSGKPGTFTFRGKPHIVTSNPWVWAVELKRNEGDT
ncbi:hypothetical protein LCGC14_1318540 [marine sediment metagenome]|uniref:Uncharacterized protein n=1 Tax=marine sediment metagenome TaxID=412755 RepID=A0A0F9N103_9ZZZZ